MIVTDKTYQSLNSDLKILMLKMMSKMKIITNEVRQIFGRRCVLNAAVKFTSLGPFFHCLIRKCILRNVFCDLSNSKI